MNDEIFIRLLWFSKTFENLIDRFEIETDSSQNFEPRKQLEILENSCWVEDKCYQVCSSCSFVLIQFDESKKLLN